MVFNFLTSSSNQSWFNYCRHGVHDDDVHGVQLVSYRIFSGRSQHLCCWVHRYLCCPFARVQRPYNDVAVDVDEMIISQPERTWLVHIDRLHHGRRYSADAADGDKCSAVCYLLSPFPSDVDRPMLVDDDRCRHVHLLHLLRRCVGRRCTAVVHVQQMSSYRAATFSCRDGLCLASDCLLPVASICRHRRAAMFAGGHADVVLGNAFSVMFLHGVFIFEHFR